LEGLEYDTVMDFEYLHQCFYEVLRIEPPAALSLHQTFAEDVTLEFND
jgi:cytochrome P450